MKKYRLPFVLIILFLFLAGCSNGEYVIEKLYWKTTKEYSRILKNIEDAKPADFQKVIIAYREIIARFPDWKNIPTVHFNISQLYVLRKQYVQARAELEKVKEKFSQRPDICAKSEFAIGLIYEEEGMWYTALERFETVENKYPLTYSAIFIPLYIARHYKAAEETEKAREAYGEALSKYKTIIEQKPDTLGALTVLDFIITVYTEQDRKDEILDYFDELIEKYPNSAIKAKALLAKGGLYYELGKTDEAISHLERIVTEFPNSPLSKMAQEQIEKIKEGK